MYVRYTTCLRVVWEVEEVYMRVAYTRQRGVRYGEGIY